MELSIGRSQPAFVLADLRGNESSLGLEIGFVFRLF